MNAQARTLDKEQIVMGLKIAIQNKNDTKYRIDKDWCLFIECSNLLFHNPQLLYGQYEETVAYVKTEIEKTEYGAVFLFGYIGNNARETYQFFYNRIDCSPSDPLKES